MKFRSVSKFLGLSATSAIALSGLFLTLDSGQVTIGNVAQANVYSNVETDLRNFFSNSRNTNGENWSNRSLTDMWDRIGGESAQFPNGGFTGGDRWHVDMPSSAYQVYKDLSTAILGSVRPVNAGYAYDQGYFNYYRKWHGALDIGAPNGTAVKTVVGGTTRVIQNKQGDHFLAVKGDDGKLWVYGHLSTRFFGSGSRVNAGQTIGRVGKGHLHLEVHHTHSYSRPTSSDRNFVLRQTMSPLHAYFLLKKGSVSSPTTQSFVNGFSRPTINTTNINYRISASNLSGKRVYWQMWRAAAYGYPERQWNGSGIANGSSINFYNLDGAGNVFRGVDYYLVASLNPIPNGEARKRRTACYSATGGQQLCDRVRR